MINKKLIALIPARAGSERVKGKNFKNFCGMPLILYTIISAFLSGIFQDILVSTNDPIRVRNLLSFIARNELRTEIEKRLIIRNRPDAISTQYSHDCEWIADVFDYLDWDTYEYYMILRPTNPFRTQRTIQRAWKEYLNKFNMAISMKSMQAISERPEKMWRTHRCENEKLNKFHPIFEPLASDVFFNSDIKGYEAQSSKMVPLFIQNGCIDICPISIIKENRKSYIGDYVSPFYTSEIEGFDINTPFDWNIAEALALKIRVNKNSSITVYSSQRIH